VQGTITANGQAVEAGCASAVGLGIQVTGTWTGTLTFQGSVDGVTWTTFGTTTNGLNPWPGTTGVATTTANGMWTAPAATIAGLVFVQVVATATITGTATVTINLTKAA